MEKAQAAYTLLEPRRSSGTRSPFGCRAVFSVLIPLLFAAAIGLGSFYAGFAYAAAQHRPSIPLPLHEQIFTHSRLHAGPPSNESNDAWKHLVPPRGGFFKEPHVAPARSTLSVFHNLHCLNGMRQGYYDLLKVAFPDVPSEDYVLEQRSSARPVTPEDLPEHAQPMHFSHCLDLIRTSVMCTPDLTVEVEDPVQHGVRGYGSAHQCADWGVLLDKVIGWQGTYGW